MNLVNAIGRKAFSADGEVCTVEGLLYDTESKTFRVMVKMNNGLLMDSDLSMFHVDESEQQKQPMAENNSDVFVTWYGRPSTKGKLQQIFLMQCPICGDSINIAKDKDIYHLSCAGRESTRYKYQCVFPYISGTNLNLIYSKFENIRCEIRKGTFPSVEEPIPQGIKDEEDIKMRMNFGKKLFAIRCDYENRMFLLPDNKTKPKERISISEV